MYKVTRTGYKERQEIASYCYLKFFPFLLLSFTHKRIVLELMVLKIAKNWDNVPIRPDHPPSYNDNNNSDIFESHKGGTTIAVRH